MTLHLLLLAAGIALLTLGGEAVVRGALAAARRLRISPLLAGLVIVGFGTSMPELVVTVDAALTQRPDIAVGNVVGSNIGNILFILGVCALVIPLRMTPLALRRDGITMLIATGLFLLLAGSSALVRLDGVVLLGGLTAYLVWAYWTESDRNAPAAQVHRQEAEELLALPRSWWLTLVAVVGGLALLIGGSRLLMAGAIGLAETAGVSEAVIGLTVVAMGTSLPELAVSFMAALRRHADVAVGNILGSNIFNVLGILGVSALLQPLPLATRVLMFDQWVMLGAAAVLLLFLLSGMRLSRAEGALLATGYTVYVALSFTMFAL